MSSPIPQPPGVPLLGNIFDIDPKNTWNSLNKLADKYGPIFKINALGTQILFVGSASLLEEICDERRFRKCVTGPIVEIRAATHDGLFTAYDHEKMWGIAHGIMAPLVTKPAVDATFISMRDTAAALVQKWASGSSSKGRALDPVPDLNRITLQAVQLCFFDQKANYLSGAVPPMITAMDRSTLECMKRPTRPKLLNSLFYQRSFDADVRTMRSYGADIIKTRRASESQSPGVEAKDDMLHALLHNTDPQSKSSLNDEQIIDEIISICIGTATAPNLVAFALYYLLKNPATLARAREEISNTLPSNEPLTLDSLSKLRYCEAALRETIRLSAVAPGFNIEPIPSPTKSKDPVSLAGGKYSIPPNQTIIAILHAVNRDPEVFDDPNAFKPERMLDEAFAKLPAGARKWFGNGKRECTGKVFGWRWALLLLVEVVRGVELGMVDQGYEVKIEGAFSVEPVGFEVTVGKRG